MLSWYVLGKWEYLTMASFQKIALFKMKCCSLGPRLIVISFEILPISQPVYFVCPLLTYPNNHKYKWFVAFKLWRHFIPTSTHTTLNNNINDIQMLTLLPYQKLLKKISVSYFLNYSIFFFWQLAYVYHLIYQTLKTTIINYKKCPMKKNKLL